MVGHIIPRPKILKEDHLGVSERNMSAYVWDIQVEMLNKKLMDMSGAQIRGLKWRCKFGNQYIETMGMNEYLYWIAGEKYIRQKGIRTSREKLQLVELDEPAKESKKSLDSN